MHLCQYLEESASRYPARVAVVDEDGTEITYRELDEKANRVAAFLAAQGVEPGDRVGLVVPKTHTALVALFGVMKLRAAYVPVDYQGPVDRVKSILTDCKVRALFLDRRRTDLIDVCETTVLVGPGSGAASDAPAASDTPEDTPDRFFDSVRLFEWCNVIATQPLPIDAGPRQTDELAYILYTSGSTGVPKGVTLTHRNATSYVDWCSEVFAPMEDDRFSSHAPLYFDLSILDLYVPIKHGASVHLIPDELGKNPKALAQFISQREITVWYSTPAILGLLAELGNLPRFDYSKLRRVLFAGEVFPVKQLRHLTTLWPHPQYYNLYGPTETNVCTFAKIPLPVPEDRSEPYPIGFLCSHCRALVIDAEGNPVIPGEEGLLYISGPSVFSGYWGREKESSAVFLERDGTRWYNTGDVVREDGGAGFIYVGRRDRMVKRRGYRIELGEVESCLYRQPLTVEAAAIAMPDPKSGTQIICYVVTPPGVNPTIVGMKSFCSLHLPSYMIPDRFLFLESLPRTATSKVDYQALKRMYSEAS